MFSEMYPIRPQCLKMIFFCQLWLVLYLGPSSVIKKVHRINYTYALLFCYFTLFPTAIVLPSGLQQIFMFSPLVFTTETHLLAAKIKQT